MNCVIEGNVASATAGSGGAIYAATGQITLMNSIARANCPDTFASTPFPASISFCNIEGGCEGEANIDGEPRFVSCGRWSGAPGESAWTNGDHRLAAGSPCIDAGNPAAEYADSCISLSRGAARNDIGAFGGPQACGWTDLLLGVVVQNGILARDATPIPGIPTADLNGDGILDTADFIAALQAGR